MKSLLPSVTLCLANLPVSLSLSRTLAFIRDLEILRRRLLRVQDLLSQHYLAGKCDSRHSATSFSENVAVAETNNLSFCNRDRAKPPSIKGNSTNSLGQKTYNEAS